VFYNTVDFFSAYVIMKYIGRKRGVKGGRVYMIDSYCGKDCSNCVSYSRGRCPGCICKTDIEIPIHDRLFITGPKKPSEDKTAVMTAEEAAESVTDTNGTEEEQGRNGASYSAYCPIAICCRNKKINDCSVCGKTYVCEKYAKKGIMDTIIEAKLEKWGVVDHGLTKAVPYLYILIGCFLAESLSALVLLRLESLVVSLLTLLFIGGKSYGYFGLKSYNTCFMALVFLNIGYMVAELMIMLLRAIDYGIIGTIMLLVLFAAQPIISVISYKIAFDAYAELVSPVNQALEGSWLKMWPLTIVFYVAAFVLAIFNFDKGGINVIYLAVNVATILLNILTFVLMIATVRVCKKDCAD